MWRWNEKGPSIQRTSPCLGPEAERTDSGSTWTNAGKFINTRNGAQKRQPDTELEASLRRRRPSYLSWCCSRLSCCWTGIHSWWLPSVLSSFPTRSVSLHHFSHLTAKSSSHWTQTLLTALNHPSILSRYQKQHSFDVVISLFTCHTISWV